MEPRAALEIRERRKEELRAQLKTGGSVSKGAGLIEEMILGAKGRRIRT